MFAVYNVSTLIFDTHTQKKEEDSICRETKDEKKTYEFPKCGSL